LIAVSKLFASKAGILWIRPRPRVEYQTENASIASGLGANRKMPRACDFALYCERNLIERFFNKLKHFRAIATRYDKLAKIFLAGVQLASAIILLN
jgi:transposase